MTTPGRPLRTFVITEDDPLYVVRFFEVFLAEYPRDVVELVGMTVDEAFHESRVATARRILRFYGARDFARLLARFAGAKLRRRSIPNLARRAGIPLLSTRSVNDPAFVERLRALDLDVIVSVAAPEIFSPELLSVARVRCINIHSGRLPKYRGMMPVFWQMRHGEPHATITVHEMAPRVDAGSVLGTHDFPLRERDDLHRVMTETKFAGARLMIDVLRQVRDGADEPRPLDMAEAGYFSFPAPEDVTAFRRRGHRML